MKSLAQQALDDLNTGIAAVERGLAAASVCGEMPDLDQAIIDLSCAKDHVLRLVSRPPQGEEAESPCEP